MASFTDRLRILLDWDGKAADTGLKKFTADIRSADGVTGKMKATWSGAMDGIRANAGTLAATGGAALVAFGVKAVGAFTDAAKAAIDLGKATGLSTEQASRWIAVGDDFGVTAENIQGAVGKIAKDLDADKWERYGIATRDAAGRARDANDILLDVMDVLSRTNSDTERARIGAELLGKGWQAIAPMLGKTRSEYEDMLATVEDGQVITAAEAKKAEKMRLAQDKLNDALGEFTLAVGEAVAGIAPLVEGLADVVAKANELGIISAAATPPMLGMSAASDDLAASLRQLLTDAMASGDAIAYLTERGYSADGAIEMLRQFREETFATAGGVEGFLDAVKRGADETVAAAEAERDAATAKGELGDAISDVETKIREQIDAMTDAIDSTYDYESASLDLADAVADLAQQQAETERIMADSTLTEEEKAAALRDLRRAQIGTAEGAMEQARAFARSQGAADGTVESFRLQKEELIRLKDQFPALSGAIDAYIAKLNAIPATKTTAVSFVGAGPKQSATGTTGPRVEGVGPSRSGLSLTINVTPGGAGSPADYGQAVADALTRWWNDGGRASWMAA